MGLLNGEAPSPCRRRIFPPATGPVPEPDPSALGWRFSSAPWSGGGLSLTCGYDEETPHDRELAKSLNASCGQGFKWDFASAWTRASLTISTSLRISDWSGPIRPYVRATQWPSANRPHDSFEIVGSLLSSVRRYRGRGFFARTRPGPRPSARNR